MSIRLRAKHGRETHKVDVVLADGVPALKLTLEALTGVPPARQTIVAKGRKWRDDDDLAAMAATATVLLPNDRITMLGSAAPRQHGPPKPKPARPPQFAALDAAQAELDLLSGRVSDVAADLRPSEGRKREVKLLDELLTRHLITLDGVDSGGLEVCCCCCCQCCCRCQRVLILCAAARTCAQGARRRSCRRSSWPRGLNACGQ